MEREEQITARLATMPRKYRAAYKKAIEGKSLRSAINAQCLHCVCWQSREVTLCTDLACPLYSVRPYRNPGNGNEGGLSGSESTNSDEGGNN